MSCSPQVILKVKKSKLVIVSFKVVNICLKLHTQERINLFFHNVVPKCWEVNKQSPTIVRSRIGAVEVCSWPPTPKGQTSYSSQVGRNSYPRAWVHAFHPPWSSQWSKILCWMLLQVYLETHPWKWATLSCRRYCPEHPSWQLLLWMQAPSVDAALRGNSMF